MSNNNDLSTHDFLFRGDDYLTQHPDFELVGREDEVKKLIAVLMRSQSNSALLVGRHGVGGSAICKGMQQAKKAPNAPFDLISKRFFWLDSDGLFASGDSVQINEGFNKTLKTLEKTPNSVLILDDTRDFIDAVRNNGVPNLINALMRFVRQNKTQIIFETRDEDLDVVLKAHSDMRERYTVLDVQEPYAEQLEQIVGTIARKRLEKFHDIAVSDEAIQVAIEMTSKYRVRDMGLSSAQPACSISLLDRALTTYRQSAHSKDPRIVLLEKKLAIAEAELSDLEESNVDKRSELVNFCQNAKEQISQLTTEWNARQETIKALYADIRDGEKKLRELENELMAQMEQEEETRQNAIKRAEEQGETAPSLESFSLGVEAVQSDAVSVLKEKIRRYEQVLKEPNEQFKALTKAINDTLLLEPEHVLSEFSRISGISVSKLTQDERAKLLNLDKNLKSRVFGQDNAVTKLANQVKVSKAGLQSPNKPQAAFLFLGPSGVGKTELGKALTSELLDDEGAMLRFDMSEYMEKHAVAKLIGAPPGYEGYEAGGILTNEMRRNPRRIILFDEIEKAHTDIFNVFLQILDDARLTDNRGLTVSFRDAIILMTTNIGTPHFLKESDPTVAEALALEDLDNEYRPEFLNRFNGRQNIVCFNTLGLPVIEMIAQRDIAKLAALVKSSVPGLSVTMPQDALSAMCADHYKPINGARGITGYLEGVIKPEIANTVLFNVEAKGEIVIDYDTQTKSAVVRPPVQSEDAVASPNVLVES